MACAARYTRLDAGRLGSYNYTVTAYIFPSLAAVETASDKRSLLLGEKRESFRG